MAKNRGCFCSYYISLLMARVDELSTWWVLEEFSAHREINEEDEDILVEARQKQQFKFYFLRLTHP